ncbi:hypothetical protein HWV62_26106 [Athelia sp. TMB]|nr:hypothetical protein HWV62_26106 [Athelia sp. TMB]
MGNDGGSIPDRRDLVKTKVKAEQADKANQTRARWFFCALSKQPLREPIVACALGKLYNKDAILEYLIDKSAYGDGEKICSHIRSLKDLKTLKLTPNSAPLSEKAVEASTSERPQFACPLTMKEMNGVVPFVYLLTCGCVFSQAGLKTVSGSTSPKDEEEAPEGTKQPQLEVCPQCATKFDKTSDVLILNPSMQEEENMFAAMLARRAAEPAKKSKKRKAAPVDETAAPAAKKVNGDKPHTNPSISAASRAVVSSLASEEAKRKAGMSDAVKSLYSKKGEERKETFMTMGTFTRYA